MPLRNKDGSLYTLPKPNPVMKTQELWTEYVVHNMEWKGESVEDVNKIVPIESDFTVQDTFLSALDKAKIEIKEPEVIDRTPIVMPDLQKKAEIAADNGIQKVFIHCLPAQLRERKDELYGDVYRTIEYGKPTSFEGVILSQEDLSIRVWTDTDTISLGSVLYPKTRNKRWWQVKSKENQGGGWVLTGLPSDFQPSFIDS